MPCPTPRDCLHAAIARWEGEWQDDPNDRGNWAHGWDGSVRRIGTMRGVTPDAFARHLGIDPASLTPDRMRAEITLAVAAEIGVAGYYRGPGFDCLTWGPLVEIAVDIGWGSGPMRAIRMLQRQIGAVADGVIGDQTAAALDVYLAAMASARAGIEGAVEALSGARADYYVAISRPGTGNEAFRRGWLRRAEWYRPANTAWWQGWRDWRPAVPARSARPLGLAA